MAPWCSAGRVVVLCCAPRERGVVAADSMQQWDWDKASEFSQLNRRDCARRLVWVCDEAQVLEDSTNLVVRFCFFGR